MSAASIATVNLSYAYPGGRQALVDINISTLAGEKVAVVGPNGAGKSTLLLNLNGLLHGAGSVLIDGSDARKLRPLEWRRRVGLVFQNPDDQLVCPTVREEVAFGPLNFGLIKNGDAGIVERALGEVGLTGFDNRSVHELSLGEKKRVAIASVLACEPQVLALDEPTSFLDPRSRRGLINLLKGMQQTVVVATHDLDFVLDACVRCYLIFGGRIVAGGKANEILRDKTLLEAHDLELPLSFAR